MHCRPLPIRRTRRGNYATLVALSVTGLLGFAALAVDMAVIRMAQAQAQNAADAAAHAALIVLRDTQDTAAATAAAVEVAGKNSVFGKSVKLDPAADVVFGAWDFQTKEFDTDAQYVNSVQVNVRLAEGAPNDPIQTYFAWMFGADSAKIGSSAPATSALRSRDIVVVQDVTGSFADEIDEARDADLLLLDYLYEHGLERDKIGMVTFAGAANVWTDLQYVQDNYGAVRGQWQTLTYCNRDYIAPSNYAHHNAPQIMHCNTANQWLEDWWYKNSGTDLPVYWSDVVESSQSWFGHTPVTWNNNLINVAKANGWTSPASQWAADSGTFQGSGLEMGIDVLMDAEFSSNYSLKTIILISDGYVQCIGATATERKICEKQRYDYGLAMADWAEENNISIYSVSLNNSGDAAQTAYMAALVRGYGDFYETASGAGLVSILEEISRSIPISLVQ